jgi:hypothetical protein
VDEAHHGKKHRHLSDIRRIIQRSGLREPVKETALAVFHRLAAAEARVHGIPEDAVHFHEVGAVDAILDIVGAVAGLDILGVEEVYCSSFHVGSGTIRCAHGTLPLPAPATAELLRGYPVYSTGVEGELLTPTGAAILTTVARTVGPAPAMTLVQAGYGAGTVEREIPNLLRVFLGERPEAESDLLHDRVAVMETQIDDMTPEVLGHVSLRLMEEGALDVFCTPVQMKHNRPGTLLTVLAPPEDVPAFARRVLAETSTIGIRWRVQDRLKAPRQIRQASTPWGPMRFKVIRLPGGFIRVSPEYADCRRISRAQNAPLLRIMEDAFQTAGRLRSEIESGSPAAPLEEDPEE